MREEMTRRADRGGEAAAAAKLARLSEEEAAKVAELDERYRVRVRLRPAGLLVLDAPVRTARLRLRRRKLSRAIEARYHLAVRGWEPLVCEGCGEETRVFAACDEAVHLLCRACSAGEGRVDRGSCRGCSGKGLGEPPPVVVERVSEAGSGGAAPSPEAAPSLASSPAFEGEGSPPEASAAPGAGQFALPFDPEEAVRAQLGPAPGLTALEVAARAGLPVELVRPVLRRLVRAGLAVTEGRTRATRYRRSEGRGDS
jgi:hypothetical protein